MSKLEELADRCFSIDGDRMQELTGDEWDNDEDAAEVSDDLVAVHNGAEPSVELVRPDLVERVIKSLTADADRGEGQLKRSDVNRTYLRKQLSIAECTEVESQLLSAGYIIVEDDETFPIDDATEDSGYRRKTLYLTHAEERALGRCIQLAAQLPPNMSHLDASYVQRVKRDADKAREVFVSSNIQYVNMLARRRGERRYIATEDLQQEGFIGLLRAVELYDPERGFRFKTYATWWIEQRIERAIADEDRIVRLPVHLREKLTKIRRAQLKLTFVYGRPATEDELASELGIERDRLMKLLWRVQATEVAEGDFPITEDVTLLSALPDQSPSQFETVSQYELKAQIKELLSTLTPREERILRMRFGVGVSNEHTLEEIGQQFLVTRERIRQIEAKALRKLRRRSRSRHLLDFLEG